MKSAAHDSGKRIVKDAARMVHRDSRRFGKNQKIVIAIERFKMRRHFRFGVIVHPIDNFILGLHNRFGTCHFAVQSDYAV